MSGLTPAFVEESRVADARSMAARLAPFDRPLLVVGEPGTGRRTLAAEIAARRAESQRATIVVFRGFDGMPAAERQALRRGLRPGVTRPLLLAHRIERFDPATQLELADLTRRRRVLLVATADPPALRKQQGRRLIPELDLLLEPGSIRLAPLRDRGGDVVRWAVLFLERASRELGIAPPPLSTSAVEAIRHHPWPGNLAELESAVKRAAYVAGGTRLEPADFGLECARGEPPSSAEITGTYVRQRGAWNPPVRRASGA